MKDVVLVTDRITLNSPIGFVSEEDVLNAINCRETLEFLSPAPYDYSLENARSFLKFLKFAEASEKMLELGIFDKETNKYLGMLTLENIDLENATCEIGYWLTKSHTGKGIATEVATELIKYAFNVLQIKRIDAFVIKEHIKSIKLLERLGFKQKELLLNNEENKGKMVDRYWYALDRD